MLLSVGQFRNRTPWEERGSFNVWALPCGSPNLFNSGTSFPVILLILILWAITTIWEDSRFRGSWRHRNMVFGLTHKELISHHSHATRTQLNEIKTNISLNPLENAGHRACPQNRRDRQVNTENYSLPGAEASAETSTRVGKLKL